MQLKTITAIGCVVVTLAACGGGGGGGDTGQSGSTAANASVPASAFQSVDSFIAYVRGLMPDETSEPLTLPDGAAPISDTAEPAA